MIKALGLEDDSKVNDTPAADVLALDKDRKSFKEKWSCRSAQGMLTYLDGSTCPDI